MAAAVLNLPLTVTLNSATTLYVCDIHERLCGDILQMYAKLSAWITAALTVISLLLVPVYASGQQLLICLQQLWGLFSMRTIPFL